MATEKMIRSLAKDLATLIAMIDHEEESSYIHEVDRFSASEPTRKQTKHITPKKTDKKD